MEKFGEAAAASSLDILLDEMCCQLNVTSPHSMDNATIDEAVRVNMLGLNQLLDKLQRHLTQHGLGIANIKIVVANHTDLVLGKCIVSLPPSSAHIQSPYLPDPQGPVVEGPSVLGVERTDWQLHSLLL